MPDGADLEDHHADGVGDDVVELARDAGALLGHGEAGGRLPLALGVVRPDLRRLGPLDALAHGEAGEPADREQQRGEEQLARVVARIVVHDDRGPAEHDRQAIARLDGVAQVAE